jgi:glycosyltransferase involved in cell wall biosynthesis
MTDAPEISVVMAVYNGQQFLSETLRSVLNQSHTGFEFLVIDDASDDETPSILAQAAAEDDRIRIIPNECNMGLTLSLNVGLRAAKGTYIARIDADDVCLPDRLEKQLAFMEANPDHTAVACGHHVIDASGRITRKVNGGLDDWQIRWLGGFNPPAPHPTYFFRRNRADGALNLYDETFRTAQDFELWSRLAQQGKTRVLPDVLVKYRRHANAITVVKRREQAVSCALTGRANLGLRLPADIVSQLDPLIALFSYQSEVDRSKMIDAIAGCDAMLAHDLKAAPTARHRGWVRRMTAGLLAETVLSRAGGLRSILPTLLFCFYARRYLPTLFLAVAADPAMALKSLKNVARY